MLTRMRGRGIARQSKTTAGILLPRAAHPAKIRSSDGALARMAGGLERVDPAALAAYRLAFRDPAVRHAICEDCRAAMNEDLELDKADRAQGRKLGCPVQVLWPTAETRPALRTRSRSGPFGRTMLPGRLPAEVICNPRTRRTRSLSHCAPF